MNANVYRDLIGNYVDAQYGRHGLTVYSEVYLGKTIIGKTRRVDLFILRREDQRSLALAGPRARLGLRSMGLGHSRQPYAD